MNVSEPVRLMCTARGTNMSIHWRFDNADHHDCRINSTVCVFHDSSGISLQSTLIVNPTLIPQNLLDTEVVIECILTQTCAGIAREVEQSHTILTILSG